MAQRYSDHEIQQIITAGRVAPTYVDAAKRLTELLGRPVTANAVHGVLSRHAEREPEPAPDPLAEAREKKSHARLRSAHDDLCRQLEESLARQAFLDSVGKPQRPLSVPTRRLSRGTRQGVYVAAGSDWHVEEQVTRVSNGYRNEYDLKIADTRIQRFFEAVCWMVAKERKAFDIDTVVCALLGDLMSGFIHLELLETNALSPTETALWLRPRILRGLRMIADRTDARVLVPCVPGNHGRTTQKTHIKTITRNSYEWLLYKVMAEDVANDPVYSKRIQFDAPEAAHAFTDVFDDFCLHWHHGDSVKFAGGIGGITVPLKKKTVRWDKAFIGGPSRRKHTIHHIGHFHQFIDIGDTLVNGSLIGWNDYAAWIGCDYEPPQQFGYVLDSKRGKTSVSPLWVSELEAA